jgi:cell division protease FtsH
MKPTHNNKKPGDNSGLLGAVFALAAAAGGAYMLYKQTKDMNDGGLGQQRDPNVNNRNKTWIPTQKSEEKKPGTTTFDDVAGIDEAIEEVKDIVGYLKDPSKAGRLGGKVSRGVLLEGPPGNGKTLLARAMAGEANVPFYEMPGSAFVEKYVGVGASRVRSLFDKAKKNAPCIIFIDEIDAVGRHRSAGSGEGGARESDQTLNQLLTELDGFQGNTGVIIIGATNRSDVLDPALLRPGRFDTQVVVPVPDIKGREDILNIYLKNKPVAKSVDSSILARSTPGFSGAQLADLVNKAALTAEKADKDQIEMEDFSEAREKILMGGKRNAAMTEEEAKLTAYHEAGHTIIGKKVKGNDPVHKVTIIPRGRALGVTMSLPEKDKLTHKKSEMKAMLAMLYGGRVAEQKIFGLVMSM